MVAQSLGREVCGAPLRGVSVMPDILWSGDFMAGRLPSGMTFGRASDGGYFDASGTWQVAGSDVARFDYDPVTLLPRGLLFEESRTNSLRSGEMGGLNIGKINGGAGGLAPSHWGIATNTGGDIWVTGAGTEYGLQYMDLRFTGSPSSGSMLMRMEETTQIAAASGQVWTGSCLMRMVGGSTTNVGVVGLRVEERNSSGTVIGGATADSTDPVGSGLTRLSVTRTFNNAGTAYALLNMRVQTLGGAIDITLRIYATQLERGAVATSYIKTNGAAATRAADSLIKTQAGLGKGTLVAQAIASGVGQDMAFAALSDNSTSNAVNVLGVASSTRLAATVTTAGSSQASMFVSGTWVAMVPKKVGVAWRKNDFELAVGSSLVADSAGNVPVTSQIDIGRTGNASTSLFNGWIQRVTLYRDRLANGRLQELVKG